MAKKLFIKAGFVLLMTLLLLIPLNANAQFFNIAGYNLSYVINPSTQQNDVIQLIPNKNCGSGFLYAFNKTGGYCGTAPEGSAWAINSTTLTNNSNTLTVNITYFEGIYAKISNLVSYVGNWSADKVTVLTTSNYSTIKQNVDTNDTKWRENVTGYDCGPTQKALGHSDNGTVVCIADIDTDTNIVNSSIQINRSQVTGIGNRSVGVIVGFTQNSHGGNLTVNGFVGYTAANNFCQAAVPGSHFCFEVEVLKTISEGNYSFSGSNWIAKGAPGYTAEANDCSGFTTNSSSSLGAFWNWDSDGDAGQGKLTNCAQAKSLVCCA